MLNARDLGARPGNFDNTSPLQSLIDKLAQTRERGYLPAGTYKHSGLVIRSGVEITGDGHATVLQSAANSVSLDCSDAADFAIRNVTLMGTAPNYTGGSPIKDLGQIGIMLSNSMRFDIEGVSVYNMAGNGLQYQNSPAFNRGEIGANVDRFSAASCYRGIYTLQYGEYATFNRLYLVGNIFAAWLDSGNITFGSGCKLIFNSVALKLTGGGNNGHGILSGCQLNHNVCALIARNVSLGFVFDGCDFIADQGGNSGRIEIFDSRGLTFNGGHLGCNVMIDGQEPGGKPGVAGPNNGWHSIRGMYVRTDLPKYTAPDLRNGAQVLIRDNITPSGPWAANN